MECLKSKDNKKVKYYKENKTKKKSYTKPRRLFWASNKLRSSSTSITSLATTSRANS